MKKYFSLVILLLLATYTVQAGNSYLQKFDHYQVTSMGGNVLRFTIPIWVYGEGDDNTYYLRSFTENDNNKNNSYLWYSETNDEGDIKLRYYSSILKNTFISKETFLFQNDEQKGSYSKPYTPEFIVEE